MTIASILLVLAGEVVTVPVDSLSGWTALSYHDIPPNEVGIVGEALRIEVDRSSSPLVYRFESPLTVQSLSVRASWHGRLDLPEGRTQGDESADDFVLKFGLVEAGDRNLNWLQRRFAADWILKLHDLAPAGRGIERIRFFSTTCQPDLVGTRRLHPLSELLYEERILHLESPGPFQLTASLEGPREVLGLWISADGDDTGSTFDLTIERIELRTSNLDTAMLKPNP